MMHSYSQEMASFLMERWNDAGCTGRQEVIEIGPADQLPALSSLEHLISTCYQASLLREEERPVRFRLILCEPDRLSSEEGPPTGLHRLIFTEPRPFNEHELQRIFPSADFYRSLIGIRLDQDEGLQIWGIVHSGPRWIQNIYGGRQTSPTLPSSLVVCVTDPGRMTVSRGPITVATLRGGQISCPKMEVFDTEWFPASFAPARADLWALHIAARDQAGGKWAKLDPDIVRRIAQQVDRRVISAIRNSRHGGTLIFLPRELIAEFSAENRYMTIKYKFVEEEPRYRFRTLLVNLLNALAEEYGQRLPQGKLVGWDEYVASKSEVIAKSEESIFELAHLIAGLAAVDGAVVLTNKYELLGYGAEISGEIEKVTTVAEALDAEGTRTEQKAYGSVGTRHRSVYRLCNALHDVIAIVVSQDRTARFVKWKDGTVTYWDQIATSVLDF